jgi:hypothetical protein
MANNDGIWNIEYGIGKVEIAAEVPLCGGVPVRAGWL